MGFLDNFTNKPTPTAVEPTAQPTTPQTEPIETPTPTEPTTPINENNAGFFKHINTPRDTVAPPPTPEETTTEQQPTPDETKAAEEKKANGTLSPEACKSAGTFIADIKDLAFPKLIAYLGKNPDKWEQYKADPDSKKAIAEAWTRYLAEKQVELTPGWQIVIATTMGYGIPLGMMAFERLMRYFDEKKEKEEAAAKMQQEWYNRQMQTTQPIQQTQVAPTQAMPTATQQAESPKPQETTENNVINEEISTETTENTQQCPQCAKTFKMGEGYPLNPKSQYYQLFCGKSCLGKHTAKKSAGNRKKDKPNEPK
jgi:hypothetical protein